MTVQLTTKLQYSGCVKLFLLSFLISALTPFDLHLLASIPIISTAKFQMMLKLLCVIKSQKSTL